MNAPASPPFNEIKTLRAGMELPQKIDLIQQHIQLNHFGENTIPYCMLHDGNNVGSIRPWTDDDFEGQSIRAFRSNTPDAAVKITAADWLNNENSTSFSGEYLLSQVFRYEATDDDAALDECRRALHAIQAIAALAGTDRFGWLCKPYGGRPSPESSPDQNICALSGLWAFLPHASAEEAAWIEEIIAAVPRYWEKIDYTIDFGDHVWDIRHDVSHMRIFMVANLLAHRTTNDTSYLDAARRLQERYGRFTGESASLFDTYSVARPGFFADWLSITEFAGASLLFAPLCLNLLCQLEPEHQVDYRQAFTRALDHGLIGMNPSYFGHYYRHEVKATGAGYVWRPLRSAEPSEAEWQRIREGKLALYEYPHQIYWFDATSRLPLAYMLYLRQGGAPLPGVERHVREVMEHLDFARLHWMVDPQHDQTIPELQYMLHALTSEASNYLAAYWLGRTLNFW